MCIRDRDKTVRYIDQPIHPPQTRSKALVSNGQSSPSDTACDAANIPRSTSVSIPATKRNRKERNKLHLTLSLSGTDSGHTTGIIHNHQSTNATATGPIAAVLTDVDDNYSVMSPAGVLDSSLNAGQWGEVSPEDTRKYNE